MPRFRSSELLIVYYFVYVAVIAPFMITEPWRAWLWALGIIVALFFLGAARSELRDWLPLAFTLSAYREMDLFASALHDHHLENTWVIWDRWLLDQMHLRAAIESIGPLIPAYLELCYLLVYGVAPIALAALLLNGRRAEVNRFWLGYLAATLGCYALFPYFPSDPPRTIFVGLDLPSIVTPLRRLNLWIVRGYGIHSSVFPSAHVASAFSAAWALLVLLPQRRWIGWAMIIYAFSVAVATVYGRYHYAADALAGIAMSGLGYFAVLRRKQR